METIGDAYMLVCGVTTECDDQVDKMIGVAQRMIERSRHVSVRGEPIEIRVGIHSGPVVGGVVGVKMPRCVAWGGGLRRGGGG